MFSPVTLGSEAGGSASRPILLSPWTTCQPAGFLTATANVPTAATIPDSVPIRTANGTAGAHDGTATDHDGTATSYDGTAANHDGTATDHDGTAADHDGTATDHDGTAIDVNGAAIHSAGSVSISRTEVLVTATAIHTGTYFHTSIL